MRRVRSPRIALRRSDRRWRWRSSGGGDSSTLDSGALFFRINTLLFASCNSQHPKSLESIELVLTLFPFSIGRRASSDDLQDLFDPQHRPARSLRAPRAPRSLLVLDTLVLHSPSPLSDLFFCRRTSAFISTLSTHFTSLASRSSTLNLCCASRTRPPQPLGPHSGPTTTLYELVPRLPQVASLPSSSDTRQSRWRAHGRLVQLDPRLPGCSSPINIGRHQSITARGHNQPV
jgi:hypothetical protein